MFEIFEDNEKLSMGIYKKKIKKSYKLNELWLILKFWKGYNF